jgi:transposase-like protein
LDNCAPGEVGAILRREGVYSSSISTWRQQRRDGQLGTAKRGPKALVPVKSDPANNSEAQQLRRENRRLKRELETALLAIEIQKKLSQLMEIHRRNDEFSSD